jgi:UDP-GlcNAc:undecaprenyl-phosphate GlcNAc-1-phosphate transferase
MIFFSTLLLSMFITISLIPLVRRAAVRVQAMDLPDGRKVHPYPMPKSGGLAMSVGLLVPVLLWVPMDHFARAVLAGAGVLVVFGLVDDLKGLGYRAKFMGQIAAALIVIFYGGLKIESLGMLLPDDVILPDWISIPLTLIAVVGVTNAINLSDGLDGLAGGICLLSFCCLAYLAYRTEYLMIATFSMAAIGAIIGFLRFNTYPATLFMGDAGSQLLGFTAVTLSVGLTQANAPLSPVLPLIILGFPILDTLTVMSERIAKGKSPFKADKNHLHHKLLELNLFHTEAVFVIYVAQALLVTLAFVLRFYSDWLLLGGYGLFCGIVVFGFIVAEKSEWKLQRGFLDSMIKQRLKGLKHKNRPINVSFRISCVAFAIIVLVSCMVPENVPRAFSLFTGLLIIPILMTQSFKRDWLAGVLRTVDFLFVSVLIYVGETSTASWMNGVLAQAYNLSFGVLALFSILTLKFTKRRKGFKTSPVDFLILFIALVVPNMPDERIRALHMGLVAAKIIVLFFSFEVIVGEVRGKLNKLALFTLFALAVSSVRGFL